MLSYPDALASVLSHRLCVRTERIPLLSASGRILASPVEAPWPLPRFDNSSMDGFCLRAGDVATASVEAPVRLSIIGESAAGVPFAGVVGAGQCARISTGARIAPGADCVVPIERVVVEGDSALFREPSKPGHFIRRRGEDVAEGATLFGRGKRISPATLAFLAMYNLADVEVLVPPRVGILTSGEEVRLHGAALGESDIVGSNVYYLAEELRLLGCEPRLFGVSPDDPAAFRAMLEEALDWSDLVATTAGVSVGEHDVVGRVLKDLRAEVHFWKISVRPGKPMLFAHIGEKPLFCFPGNPVSVCCNTEILLKPFLRQSLGMSPVVTPRVRMRLVRDSPRDKARLFFCDARASVLDGEWVVEPVGNQSSGNLGATAHANALIVLEPGGEPAKSGEVVDVMPVRAGE